jgi:hypothetical protein
VVQITSFFPSAKGLELLLFDEGMGASSAVTVGSTGFSVPCRGKAS